VRNKKKIDFESLGRMLADYCASQGWTDDLDSEGITLSDLGVSKLSGPPYFFDLSNPQNSFEEQPVENYQSAESTFTWHQKNFSPGKTRQTNEKKQAPQGSQDLYNWKPGLISQSVRTNTSWVNHNPRQQPQRQQKRRPSHNQRNSSNGGGGNNGGGTIKMKISLPPIARTGKKNFKKKQK